MRKLLPVVVSLFVVLGAWSQSVDEGELKSVGEREIVFESYTGAHTVFDTAEEIVGIGRALALGLKADGKRGDFFGLYSVIRAVDPAETQKLDADIIVFADKAGVDHIRNVRRIIAGYVETAFGYSRADAELLATFVTYYNAVYRGRIQDLAAKYSAAVMGNVSAENAGIALSYREWPGKTRLLIPHARKGTFGVPAAAGETPSAAQPSGGLSTTELTQKEVVAELRNEPGSGLDERKAMVDLKEREVEAAKANVAAEEKKLEERKAEVAAREAAAAAPTQPEGSTQPAPSTRPKQPEVTSAPAAAAQPAATTPAGEKAAAAAKPEEKPVAEEKAAIAAKEAEVAATKEAVAAKEAEIARDREGIVADEKTASAAAVTPTEPAAKPAVSESVLFLIGRGSAEGGRLVVIDPVKRALPASSASGGITVPDFAYFKESVVVLAREGGIVHLLLLDPKTLAVTARGQDAMYAGSYLHSQAGAIYAVTVQGKAALLGRYDEKLGRTALSADAVDKDTYIRIFGDEVFVSAPDGSILVLAAADLTRKGQIAK